MPSRRTADSPETVFAVRVKPGSSRVKVGGRYDGSLGPALVVAVQAPAVDGRATEATRQALAKALGLPASAIRLRSGAAARDKLFTVDSPPAGFAARLADLIGDAP